MGNLASAPNEVFEKAIEAGGRGWQRLGMALSCAGKDCIEGLGEHRVGMGCLLVHCQGLIEDGPMFFGRDDLT